MNRNLWLGLVAAVGVGAAAFAQSQTGEGSPPVPNEPAVETKRPDKPPTSNQLLMGDKLTYANKALDGLAVEDFGKIAESGKYLRMISRAASWHVMPTVEYVRFSKNFQEQASDLERHATDKNLDAASMDYMRITLTCVQCHKYMRETRAKQGK